ncbi:HlyD family secretion protein [Massilia violaceinigra]|nr:HlyD family efflux transporter periplasmic adaptor subunit [Massilia violaceinigra]
MMNLRRLSSALLVCMALTSCSETGPAQLTGYVEGEFVRVVAPFAGALVKLHVRRGQHIEAGMPLFSLEDENEASARKMAAERLQSAQAHLDDLMKGKRSEELDVTRSQLAQSVAMEKISATQLDTSRELVAKGFVSRVQEETAQANNLRDRARIAELEHQLTASQLGGRVDQLRIQKAEIAVAKAQLRQSDWQLRQKSGVATRAGLVFDTLYSEGDWIASGNQVITILPPGAIKVRFFASTAALASLKVGQTVKVQCDGCAREVDARINYISPQAEYTPPVIYSKDSQAKLVFLVEALPVDARDGFTLHPGQPIRIGMPR